MCLPSDFDTRGKCFLDYNSGLRDSLVYRTILICSAEGFGDGCKNHNLIGAGSPSFSKPFMFGARTGKRR